MLGASTRLKLSPSEQAILLRMMATFGQAERRAYAHSRKHPADPLCAWIQAHTPLTSHQAASVEARVVQLHAHASGTRTWTLESEALRVTNLKGAVKALDRRIKAVEQAIAKEKKTAQRGHKAQGFSGMLERAFRAKNTRPKPSLAELEASLEELKLNRFGKSRKWAAAETRYTNLQSSPASGKAHVFGGRKLQAQRHRLNEKDSPHGSLEVWRAEWDRRRNGSIWLIGKGASSFGNQIAQVDTEAETLALRLPEDQAQEQRETEALRRKRGGAEVPKIGSMALKRLTLPNVRFSTTHTEEIRAAQALKLPITVRLQHQLTPKGKRQAEQKKPNPETGFYLHLSYDLPAPSKITSHVQGVLGIDLNANSLAWAITDPTGNPMRVPGQKGLLKGTIRLKLKGLTADQSKARVRAAVQILVGLAVRFRIAVAAEALDFSFRKIGSKDKGPAYARMLSSLRTAGFAEALRACCRKYGIPLHQVDPKWTSVAGFAKYGIRNRFSVDQAAAFQIARTGLLGRHHPQEGRSLPTHAQTGPRAGKKLSPAFVRELRAQREDFIVKHQESVRLSAPLPLVLQKLHRKHVGQGGAATWQEIRKVVGWSRKRWVSRLLGRPDLDLPVRRLGVCRKARTGPTPLPG